MENVPINGFRGPKGFRGLGVAWMVLLTAAVLAVFSQCAGFGFLRFDDPDYTFTCPFVKDGLSWSNVCEAFRNLRHGAIWMPATWISYMAGISFFGAGAAGHHAVNVALHVANTLLLFVAVRTVAGNVPHPPGPSGRLRLPAAAVLVLPVLFWAVHPQRVEAVAWIASRKELVWSFFALLGFIAWYRGRCAAACLCCALACMGKPAAMVFPVLLAVMETAERAMAKAERRRMKDVLPESAATAVERSGGWKISCLALMFAMAVATGVVAMYSQTHPEGMSAKDLFYAPLGERLLNAIVSMGLYLAQMAVPVGIHLDYRAVPGGWPLHAGIGLAVFAAALAVVAFKGLEGFKGLKVAMDSGSLGANCMLFAAIFFLVAVLPTLGLFASFGEHARADRFLYVPSMALPFAVAFWMRHRESGAEGSGEASSVRPSMSVFAGLSVLVLAVFSWQSFRVASSYRDDVSAFTRTLACDPGNGRALAHVGEARCAAGALDEGIDMLRRSREVRPRDATDGKLAYALMRRGRSSDWTEIRTICAPFASDPARDLKGQALEALGTAELKARNWKKAAEFLGRSILAPARFYSAADAKLKLAFAWHNGGRRTEARKLFEAVSRYTRADLSARADEVLAILDRSPNAMLFW